MLISYYSGDNIVFHYYNMSIVSYLKITRSTFKPHLFFQFIGDDILLK